MTIKPKTDFDAIVIGAGFSGLYMLHKLRNDGYSVKVFEAGDNVGGTWYWNRYPGARCDVESIFYSYTFSEKITQEWTWSSRFAEQPEILNYINYVADELDLRKDIQFKTKVESAHYDEQNNLWRITLEDQSIVTSHYFITGVGALSSANVPKMKGLEDFKGEWYHTGRWPKEKVSFEGKKVGVIGTGSTGVQVIPSVAHKVKELFVFQRTPQYTTPAQNHPLNPKYVEETKANAHELKLLRTKTPMGTQQMLGERSAMDDSEEERLKNFDASWRKGAQAFPFTYNDIPLNPESSKAAAAFIQSKIREMVKNPETATVLTPDYYYGARRPIIDTNYFETYNRENVKLVNVKKDPIQQITASGIQTTNQHYELDMIIFATGYDAITGSLFKIDIRGKGGISLKEKWENGARVRTYLGLSTAGFPNMFMITGPESPSVHTNMVASIEQHVEWISDFINHANTQEIDVIEANETDELEWSKLCKDIADATLFTKVDSWFIGSNVEGKPKPKGFLFYLAGLHQYRQICNEIAAKGYQGFILTKSANVVG
jgi:cation diffusion facilitator CzcD-associated flavoprotein CzcO